MGVVADKRPEWRLALDRNAANAILQSVSTTMYTVKLYIGLSFIYSEF